MKKFLIAAVLMISTASFAQAAPQGATQTKVIKDPVEYNAYITATNLTDPTQKAAALESFVMTYPQSIVKEDALEATMTAYQQSGNAAKAADAANRILQVSTTNTSALAVLVNAKRQAANANQNPQQNFAEASQLAQRGVQAMQTATKPEGMKDDDWKKRQTIFGVVFHGAIGQAALAVNDYPTAQKNLLLAVQDNPNDAGDVYPLAISYLSPKPNTDENTVNGLWFIARALNLVAGNAAAEQQIGKFAQSVYKRYHGTTDGWAELMAQAKTTPMPPAGFTIAKYVPPSPAQQAAEMITKTPIEKMEFADWIFILTSGNQDAADKVWNTLKGKGLAFQGQVIDATKTTVTMAVTADGIEAKKPEVQVTMATPLKVAPVAGSNFKVQAAPDTYDPNPFLMKMVDGQDLDKPAPKPKAPARKPAATHKKAS